MTTRTVHVTIDQVEAARALRELLGADRTPPAVAKIADAAMPDEAGGGRASSMGDSDASPRQQAG